MGENPWWHPSQDDLDRDEPLPDLIELAPDYSADLPLWGCDGSGNIAWQDTKFSPQLLDRLLAGGVRRLLPLVDRLAVHRDTRPLGPPSRRTDLRRAL
jgi:hypothetical protein